MEPHPVPQNIMDVEFKLFGSFTLNEFLKILFGGLAALGVFISPLPVMLKFPIMAACVFVGIGLAMVKNLGVWLKGFVKALFVSPRYVWIKATETPDVLKASRDNRPQANQKVASMTRTKSMDISDLPLDKLFVTREKQETGKDAGSDNDVRDENMERVYQEVFGKDTFAQSQQLLTQRQTNLAGSRTSGTPVKTGQTMQANLSPVQNSQPRSLGATPDLGVAPAQKFKTAQEYKQEIERLKFELSKISKDENYAKKENEIMMQINDLYREFKILSGEKVSSTTVLTNPDNNLRLRRPVNGQTIFGIVVDKNDRPLDSVDIVFANTSTGEVIQTRTTTDGRFSTSTIIPKGEYAISLSDKKHKFHTYKIAIGEQNLPAYKFRER